MNKSKLGDGSTFHVAQRNECTRNMHRLKGDVVLFIGIIFVADVSIAVHIFIAVNVVVFICCIYSRCDMFLSNKLSAEEQPATSTVSEESITTTTTTTATTRNACI
ncbi:Hypothetical predicted protein [Octopus vulgaris]|uniref:Uncharacterized protein n=1 Tax=Octopus vulgaris TaxID=6645 RepID=A0AA36BIG5_OCTVU|nr:Hypothetical predicted protein [Octopus vulgaris]